MRANAAIFWSLSLFFGLAAVVYALWSMTDPLASQITGPSRPDLATGTPEWVGTVTLSLCSVLSTFIAFYIGLIRRSVGDNLPEDRVDAAIDDGDPEVGHFSPWSWWPFVLSAGIGLVFLGLAIGIWIAIIGAPIVAIAIVGWTFEYYRGNFAR